MRKLLLFLGLFSSVVLHGQWDLYDNVSNIQDTNVLTGEAVDLYEDYLDRNIAVLIFVFSVDDDSAKTNHATGILQKIERTYGLSGTGELSVVFVEEDGLESKIALEGGNDLGYNWLDSIGHIPVLSLSGIFPTDSTQLYLICPSRDIVQKDVWVSEANDAVYTVHDLCGNYDGEGPRPNATLYVADTPWYYCKTFGPRVLMENSGNRDIVDPVLQVWKDGSLLQEKIHEGTFPPNTWEWVMFDTVPFEEEALTFEYRIEIPNEWDPHDNVATETISIAPKWTFSDLSPAIGVHVRPDVWGAEVTWRIEEQGGDTLLEGGPYEDHAVFENGEWTYDTAKIITDKQELFLTVADSGCYVFILQDDASGAGGSNFCNTSKPYWGCGYYEFQSDNGEVLAHFPGNSFNYWGYYAFEMVYDVDASVKEQQQLMRYYPQPAQDVLRIELPSQSGINGVYEIVNTSGQVVLKGEVKSNQFDLNVSQLPSGMYCMLIPDSHIKPIQFVKH